jgi:general secretion pathway protein J
LRRRSGNRRGVTLMELLIAMTLVSLLSVGMLVAIRVGITALGTTRNHLMGNRRVMGAQRVLESQIEGLIPVMARCGGTKRLFFQGAPEGMRFVSSYSLEEAARGYPRILEYAVIPRDDGPGVRLVVSETPYTGPGSVASICGDFGLNQPASGASRPWVLADRMARVRLSYLARGGEWRESLAGNRTPAAVRFEMEPLEPDPSRLQMASMVVPVHANRDQQREYLDVEPYQ